MCLYNDSNTMQCVMCVCTIQYYSVCVCGILSIMSVCQY